MDKNEEVIYMPSGEQENNVTPYQRKNSPASSSQNDSVPINSSAAQTEISQGKIKAEAHRFPYCIVWTPLPCFTAFIPSVGHVGVCGSNGVIHDFAGSRYVSVDNMAFGWPVKYVKLELTSAERQAWDAALEKGEEKYNEEEYSFCCNNCHSFVANVLNKYKYKGKSNYSMVSVWWLCSTKSKYISWCALFKTYLGLIIIIVIILLFVYLFAIKKVQS